MGKLLFSLLTAFITLHVYAATISGTIREKNGAVLPFSSILVKGTTRGVSANSKGFYSIQLEPGEHVLVCQFIGYRSIEKKINVRGDQSVDFELDTQQYNLKDVV